MRLALALALLAAAPAAYAKGNKDGNKDDVKTSDDDASDDTTDATDDSGAPTDKGKVKVSDDADQTNADQNKPTEAMQKQDLTGHDLGAKKKVTAFEKDRFFVDKIDTKKTEDTTLVQGSLTSTSFIYHEAGGNLPGTMMGANVPSASQLDRLFTDLRLQTDFRHIGGGRWDARIDARARLVETPSATTSGYTPPPEGTSSATTVQSGLTGENEYDLRELWLVRNGERSDVTIGRQYITDLAAIKIDGVRVDYASSSKFTLLGFGGLYPLRGSRSVTTDYIKLEATPGNSADPAGPFVTAAGGGAAYRTESAYGAIGGVALVPTAKEQPRIFATANGYYRMGSKLDIYHFAVIDLVGVQASKGGPLTNLSAGVNYKPDQRLRLTLSFNRVDTETLNVQANQFLSQTDPNLNVVQNEATILRLATNQARASASAGLGPMQRFEITAAGSYRQRPAFDLYAPNSSVSLVHLDAATSVEVYGGITDRRSIADLRLGVDGVQTFSVGTVPYQRSKFTALRAFAAHDIKNGQGEWEAEISYSTSADTTGGGNCKDATDLMTCFGIANGSILAVGGTVYYRFNRDWLGIGSLYISQTNLKETMAMQADPSILGLSGFARIAYRF